MLRSKNWFRAKAWPLVLFGLLTAILLLAIDREPAIAQPSAAQDSTAGPVEPAAPAGQTYIGTKECASCHFEQFMAWRQTPHAKAFEIMPAKYQADATCLACHTTGYGAATGFKSLKETPNLVANSCEGCHGPGSKHAEVAKTFGQKKLTPQEEAQVRDTIYLMQPKNVCVECHLSAKHKAHPKYDK